MFVTQRNRAAYALTLWANHIEKGDVSLSANDMAGRKLPGKTLSQSQIDLVAKLRQDARDVQSNDVK